MKDAIIAELTALEDQKTKLTSSEKNLITKLKELDTRVNDIYHILEFCTLDAIKRTKLVNLLTVTLKERREVKEAEIIYINCVKNGKSLTNEIVQSKTRLGSYLRESQQSLMRIL